MEYYTDNKLYQFLRNTYKFKFSDINVWELIYGDKFSNPKLLVLVAGIHMEDSYKNLYDIFDKESYACLKYLSEKSGLPFVYFAEQCGEFRKLTLNELKEIFQTYDLPIKDSTTQKYLNDRTSSAYHNWQRDNLGDEITVSDIDLWVMHPNSNIPIAILEIKRSKIPLDSWTPYKDDYPNFKLISNLCNVSNIKFKIVYYHMGEGTTYRPEDISKVKVFDVNFKKDPPISSPGRVIPLPDFIISEEWITNE